MLISMVLRIVVLFRDAGMCHDDRLRKVDVVTALDTALETAPQRFDEDDGRPPATEVLFPEARARQRHRLSWIGGGALLLVVSLVTALVATNPTHRNALATSTTPTRLAPTCAAPSLRTSFDGIDSGLAGSILIGF